MLHRQPTAERIFVGIDPGLDGAMAYLDAQGEFLEVADTPTVTVDSRRTRHQEATETTTAKTKTVKGTKRLFDASQMAAGVQGIRHATLLAIEAVAPMPDNGVIAAFSYGYGYGLWMGLITALEVRHVTVRPGVWKKAMSLPADKQACRLAAIQRWPRAAESLKLKKHHGRAEALWLADYARQRDRSPLV